MQLRDLYKMNFINDGTRSLVESIVAPEVVQAVNDWNKNTKNLKYVLIGGLALSYYAKPRATVDSDLLFMSSADIPTEVEGFKRTRPCAFLHKPTHVEVEVLIPQAINMPIDIAQAIYNNAIVSKGVRIASPSGLIVSKLNRFKLQDQADIEELCKLGTIDLSPYPISHEWKQKYDDLVAKLNK